MCKPARCGGQARAKRSNMLYIGRAEPNRRGHQVSVGTRLQGKTAIVTGAGSGIGRASAKLFAKEGANVLAADVTDAVMETAAEIKAAGGAALGVKADAGDEAQVQALCERAIR